MIAHNEVGEALLSAAKNTFGELPLATQVICIRRNADPQQILEQLQQTMSELDNGDGVLILTDIFGSTPSNIAQALHTSFNTRLVAGLNLPMLIRVMNYPDLNLEQLADKALTGGREGVIECNQQQQDKSSK